MIGLQPGFEGSTRAKSLIGALIPLHPPLRTRPFRRVMSVPGLLETKPIVRNERFGKII